MRRHFRSVVLFDYPLTIYPYELLQCPWKRSPICRSNSRPGLESKPVLASYLDTCLWKPAALFSVIMHPTASTKNISGGQLSTEL